MIKLKLEDDMTSQDPIQTITDRNSTAHPIILAHLLPNGQRPQLAALALKAANILTNHLWPAWADYNAESLSMDAVGEGRYAVMLTDQATNLATAKPLGYAILDSKPDHGIAVLEAFQTDPKLRGTGAGRAALDVLEAATVADLEAQGKPIHGIFTYTDYPAGQKPGNDYDIDATARIQMYAKSGYPMIPMSWATPDEAGEALLLNGKVKGFKPYDAVSFLKTTDANGKYGPGLEGGMAYLAEYNEQYYGLAFLGMIKKAADQLASRPGSDKRLLKALREIHASASDNETQNPHQNVEELTSLLSSGRYGRKVAPVLGKLQSQLDNHPIVKSMKAEQRLREEVVAQLVSYENGKFSKSVLIDKMKPLMARFRDEFKIDFAELRGRNVACVCGITLDEILPPAPVMAAKLKQVSGAPAPQA